jgi:small subunit ribosomal protein S9
VVKGNALHAIGRRKTSVARVFLVPGEGNITVNKLPCDEYFGRKTSIMVVKQPLELLELANKYDIKVNVAGGGKSGQAGAVKHAISRVLLQVKGDYRTPLKRAGFLTRDAREVERKKYGRHKARKRPQFSKR